MFCSLALMYFDSPQVGIQQNKPYKTLHYSSRDILNFQFLEKSLHHIFCMISQEKCFLCYVLSTDSLSGDIRQYIHCICMFPSL